MSFEPIETSYNVFRAFVVYWVVGWGIVLFATIYVFITFIKLLKNYSNSSSQNKILNVLKIIIVIILAIILFLKITHFAIDIDPYR